MHSWWCAHGFLHFADYLHDTDQRVWLSQLTYIPAMFRPICNGCLRSIQVMQATQGVSTTSLPPLCCSLASQCILPFLLCGCGMQVAQLSDLLEKMLALDPEKRISADSALRHDFIKPFLPKRKPGAKH